MLVLAGAPVLAALPVELEPTLTADFSERDRLPQSPMPVSDWYRASLQGTWGPHAAPFPPVSVPSGADAVAWKRARVLAVAKHYLGLPYRHHHIPGWAPPWPGREGAAESAGLDCSNFTSWVYNYGLGVKFDSAIDAQANGPTAPGRLLAPGEAFEPGDLLFIEDLARTKATHVVIFIDAGHIIDDHGAGVQIRPFAGWYRKSFSHARRIIE
jgi:cell wall-associated NlpC family hydrolase